MAKNGEKKNAQGAAGEAPRVYKAGEVHKRRAGGGRIAKRASSTGEINTAGRSSTRISPPVADSPVSEKELSSADKPATSDGGTSGVAPLAGKTGEVSAAATMGTPGTPGASGKIGSVSAHDETDASVVSDETDKADMPDEGEPLPDEASGEVPKKSRVKLVIGIIVGIIVAAALVFVGFLAGSRWVRYNDEADMQGSWFVYGTNVPIAFRDGSIVINSDTKYAYSIDPTTKTIRYSLGNLSGQGRYWFNDERNMLIITDGSDYTMWSTLLEDLSYGMRRLFGNTNLPATDTSIILTRSVVEAPAPSSQSDGGQGQAPSEAASSSSGDESSEMLSVSDIMMYDEGQASEEQAY